MIFAFASISVLGQITPTYQPAVPTYYCDFESDVENAEWITWKGSNLLSETWTTGRQAHATGSHALYTSDLSIDSLGLNTHSWAKTGGYSVSAYRKLSLTQGTYTISLDYLCPNEVIAVSLVPADTLTGLQIKGTNGTDYVTLVKNNIVGSLKDLKSPAWQHVSATHNVPAAANYLLVVTYRSQGADASFGAAVDNVEVTKIQTDVTACDYAIQDFNLELIPGYVQLTWKGNASQYEVGYFNGDTLLVIYSIVPGSTVSQVDTCLISVDEFENGTYSFMVRTADCENNSGWAYVRNKLIYDPTSHCIDYLNFDAQGVQCTYGTGSWGGSSETISSTSYGYVDYGYKSRYSTHTIHYVTNERDDMTNNQLRTVPQGSFASVRLGGKEPNNNYPGGHYERVRYTIHVDSTMGVVLFRYAYVGQTGGHGSGDLTQPHLRLKLIDQRGQIINGEDCGSFLFTAPDNDADMAALNSNPRTAGWHKGKQDDGQGSICSDYVYWRDWTTVGINVQQYLGQDIQIEITNFGCGQSCHYGYAYFVLDCSDGKLGGVTCGEKPREMTADEGFMYRWYKPYNPTEPFYTYTDQDGIVRTQDPTGRTLYVSPSDTNTYYVDLMSPANLDCYFTLHASAMAQLPRAHVNFVHHPRNCVNYVDLSNSSALYGFYVNEQGQRDSVPLEGGITKQKWNIRTASGLTSIDTDTTLTQPVLVANEDDTIFVTLYIEMDGGCTNENTLIYPVPAIGPNTGYIDASICPGDNYTYGTQQYSIPGEYNVDEAINWAGCDSSTILRLQYYRPDTAFEDTLALCRGASITYNGQNITVGDSMYYFIVGTDSHGCDSTRAVYVYYEFSYIFQRWGDVLSVIRNDDPMNDTISRYDFVKFQWMRNGEPIEDATQSYYYAGAGNTLSPEDEYRVLLTHADGREELSCAYFPTIYTGNVHAAPTRLRASEHISVTTPNPATCTYFNALGAAAGTYRVGEGVETIPAPNAMGLYFLTITTDNGEQKTFKISVY